MANETPVSNNSMTQFFDQLMRIQANSMQIVGSLSEVASSSADKVVVELTGSTGATAAYELMTMGWVKNELARLDKNFQSLIGQDGTPVNVRMPDGSFKKIFETKLFKEPAKIGSLFVPSTFNRKSNYFLENFLNPQLYVSFDVTQYVDFDTDRVAVKRVILQTDDAEKKRYFDTTFKGRNDITYDELIRGISSSKISYFVDEDIVDLPVSIARYSGTFDVISYKDEIITTTSSDGSLVKQKVRKYQLNTLKFTDNLQNTTNTQTLKVGDKVAVGTATEFEVLSVDSNTNQVTLKMTSGSENVPIGVDVLKISTQAFSLKEVQKAIGFDERQVLFIKAIDKNTNMTTREFSPGVGFYSNELVIQTSSGSVTLERYYQTEVIDFGASLLYLAKEATIPAVYGEVPNIPKLDSSNFKVSLVNGQKLDTKSVDTIKKKIAQKNTVYQEISQLDVSIEKKKQELNTSKFNSDAERRAVQNQLESLIREKTSKSNLYASLIKDLSTTAKNLPSELASPKYAVRGFFPIPEPRTNSRTGEQSVIGFIISYRYLKLDDTAPGDQQYDFIDNTGEVVRGTYSSWEEIETKIRRKSYSDEKGVYVWEDESVSNSEVVNVNQISIPITKGEKVEFKVRSVSEAGWPTNPLLSDWSPSIVIPFPEEESSQEEVLSSLQTSLSEETRVNFNQDLAGRGLDTHLSSSFVQKDKYFAHSAENISSGFFLTDGTTVNLYEKLKDLDTQLSSLKALIEKAKGKLQVSIVDPDGKKYLVSNNSQVDLFAGYYYDIVSALPSSEQKGAIITTTFSLTIENTAASVLQLASKFPGGLDVGMPFGGLTATTVDDDYKRRRYDIVPLSLASMEASRTYNSSRYHSAPFQSAQALSQYVYVRSKDIGLVNSLTAYISPTASGPVQTNSYYPSTGGSSTSFVWNLTYSGASNTPGGSGGLSTFCIHTSHPLLTNGLGTAYADLVTPSGATATSPAVYPKFTHSAHFNKVASDTEGKMQTQYIPTSLTGATAERYPVKMGFYSDDRYLIGANTCGSYLYLSPASYADLLVDGTDYRSTRSIEFGEDNAIVIPIIFQFRMTDFFGSGISGTGRIGGSSSNLTNLFYAKKIGIDIAVKDESLFSFDVQVSAKYKVDSPSQTNISPAQNASLVPTQASLINQIF